VSGEGIPWLRNAAHDCGPSCKYHHAGTGSKDEGRGVSTPSEGGSKDPAPSPTDPLCADCTEPLSAHTSPILKDGEVIGLANPENSCRRFVE
jgi:hypothetical protein